MVPAPPNGPRRAGPPRAAAHGEHCADCGVGLNLATGLLRAADGRLRCQLCWRILRAEARR